MDINTERYFDSIGVDKDPLGLRSLPESIPTS